MSSKALNFDHTAERNQGRIRNSAIILELLYAELGVPRAAIDVGGGVGIWTQHMLERGIEAQCIDHPSLESQLVIPSERFEGVDLSRGMPAVRVADWALCLEVGEHLPSTQSEALVGFLTACAPIVFFSAAIPGQVGQGHINCRAPSFWRALFEARGFERFDWIRPRLLNQGVSFWFKQNLFMFARERVEIDTTFPVQHDDEIEWVSARILEGYRRSLEIAEMPIPERVARGMLRRAKRLASELGRRVSPTSSKTSEET